MLIGLLFAKGHGVGAENTLRPGDSTGSDRFEAEWDRLGREPEQGDPGEKPEVACDPVPAAEIAPPKSPLAEITAQSEDRPKPDFPTEAADTSEMTGNPPVTEALGDSSPLALPGGVLAVAWQAGPRALNIEKPADEGADADIAQTAAARSARHGSIHPATPPASAAPGDETCLAKAGDIAALESARVVETSIAHETPAIAPRADALQPVGSTAGAIPLPPAVRQVVAEIANLAKTPDKQLEIALNPEELGRVRMSFSPTETGLLVMISAERTETLDLMRRHLDLLAQEFRRAGYQEIGFCFDERSDRRGPQGGARNLRYDLPPENALVDIDMPRNRPVATGLDLRL